MYCVAYKFTLLKDSLENRRAFIKCWVGLTEYFKSDCSALGSRLHEGTGGVFYAYAQWPSKTVFDAASEIIHSEDFIKLRLKWAKLCGPSEVLFEGRMLEDLFAYDAKD